jgi:hypothetical protein
MITKVEVLILVVVVYFGVAIVATFVMAATAPGGPSKYRLTYQECGAWCERAGGVETWERSVSRQVNHGAKVPAHVSESYCECIEVSYP